MEVVDAGEEAASEAEVVDLQFSFERAWHPRALDPSHQPLSCVLPVLPTPLRGYCCAVRQNEKAATLRVR